MSAQLPPRSYERQVALNCAETLRDMAGRIESPSAAGGYLSEKGLRAVRAVLEMLDAVTSGDEEWRLRVRGYVREMADRYLGREDGDA